MFKEKRLVFMASSAEKAKGAMDKKTKMEAVNAAQMKKEDRDKVYKWDESAERGVVKQFVDEVDGSAKKIIEQHKIPTVSKAEEDYRAYGGDLAKGVAAKAIKNIPPDPKPIKDEEDTAKNARWSVWRTALLAATGISGIPSTEAANINTAKNRADAVQKINAYEKERAHRGKKLETARQVENHKQKLLDKIKLIAMRRQEQLQTDFFKEEKGKYIEVRSKLIFPDNAKDKPEDLVEKRKRAAAFLKGKLTGAELAVGGDHTKGAIKTEFDNRAKEKNGDIKTQIETDFNKEEINVPPFGNIKREVGYFATGFLASFAPDGLKEPWSGKAVAKAKALSDAGELSVDALASALESLRVEMNMEKFNTTRTNFISIKANGLFEKDKTENKDKKIEKAKEYLTTIFKSMAPNMSGDYTIIITALNEHYKGNCDEQWLENTINKHYKPGMEVPLWRDGEHMKLFEGLDKHAQTYLEGVFDSVTEKRKEIGLDKNGQPADKADEPYIPKAKLVWITQRLNSIPKNKDGEPLTLKAVKDAFTYSHAEMVTDAGKEPPKGMRERMANAEENLKNPKVKAFYNERMAQAALAFHGKPNASEYLARYRYRLLSAIGKQKKGEVKMATLKKLRLPSTVEAGAARMIKPKDLPKGLKPAGYMPRGTGKFAQELYRIFKKHDKPAGKIPSGTAVPIKFKGRIYYGIYVPKGGNLYILEKPGDNPPAPASARRQPRRTPRPKPKTPKTTPTNPYAPKPPKTPKPKTPKPNARRPRRRGDYKLGRMG